MATRRAAVLTFRVAIEEAEEPPEPDTRPSFPAAVDDQTYVVGEAIAPLTLPQASGGNGALTYALAPTVPGLTFDPARRTLTGTPTHTGTYGMTYSVVDGDENTAASDAAVLTFRVTIEEAEEPQEPDTQPSFSAIVDDQTYVVGQAIAPLTLPQATGGNGALTYALAPTVPGLTFDPAARTLTGTPTHTGTYGMTYSVVDGDENTAASDAAVLTFRVAIEEAEEPPEPDTRPSFPAAVDDQTYVVGEAIAPLTLPQASGGNGALTYALAPTVPGLTFDPARRTLTGTPTHTGTYGMTYSVVDGDENTAASDAAVLTFRVTIEEELLSWWRSGGISLTDRTLFLDVTYDGQDRRRFGEHPGVLVLSHLFDVRFADGSIVEMAFDAEKFDRSYCRELSTQFGQLYGRIPFFLRDRMPAIYVTREGTGYSGAYHNRPFVEFNFGVSDEDDLIGLDGHFLGVMIHELAHYMDARRGGEFIDFRLWISGDPGWASAAAADGEYITSYASTNHREDFAETMSAYLASRYHRERFYPAVIAHIERTIPNRLAYLDSILDDHGRMCPLVDDDCMTAKSAVR